MTSMPHPLLSRPQMLIAGLQAVLLLTACGRPHLGTATGLVLSKGQPVNRGIVQFENREDGRSYIAPLDGKGRFQFQVASGYGLPPGVYDVAVLPPTTLPSLAYAPPVEYEPESCPEIPVQYHDIKTSGLWIDVRPGSNAELRLELN